VWARVSKPRLVVYLCLFLVPTIVIVPWRHVWLYEERRLAPASAISDLLRDPMSSQNPEILLAEANRLAWVFNWPKALYVRAEELFKQKWETRNETYARVGRIRPAPPTPNRRMDPVSQWITLPAAQDRDLLLAISSQCRSRVPRCRRGRVGTGTIGRATGQINLIFN
jgi:hypothetical protein